MSFSRHRLLISYVLGCTSFAFATAKLKKRKASKQAKNTKTEEFVIEKSKVPIKIGINLLIENCSRGELKIIKNKK